MLIQRRDAHAECDEYQPRDVAHEVREVTEGRVLKVTGDYVTDVSRNRRLIPSLSMGLFCLSPEWDLGRFT
jgi:hypothetical protein